MCLKKEDGRRRFLWKAKFKLSPKKEAGPRKLLILRPHIAEKLQPVRMSLLLRSEVDRRKSLRKTN